MELCAEDLLHLQLRVHRLHHDAGLCTNAREGVRLEVGDMESGGQHFGRANRMPCV